VQLAFNAKRMDGAFNLREPAHGPLAGLLGVAAIGPVQVSGNLGGPRQAEHIDLTAQLGELHATATGTVDLTHQSAEVNYAADAPAMAPRPDLSWQKVHVRGDWHGPLASVTASGELQALALVLPQGIRIGGLNATLEARGGSLSTRARIEGTAAPGLPPGFLTGAPLSVEASIRFEEPTRPFELHASHPTFNLRARGQMAGPPSVAADLDVADVAKLLDAMPAGLSGPLRVHATAQRDGTRIQLRVAASGNLDSSVAVDADR
jgi:translocation and assembly module TamB